MACIWPTSAAAAWIAETVRVYGFINRDHIKRKFRVSTQQASIDLRRLLKANPGTIAYDGRLKRYVLREGRPQAGSL
jgi:hypothetical protein